ncbi:hypothetical protein [Polluticoccus soli]|uniref:hypothetical protein n=1 Tax=Polluticoccus soli TaxID=3034150 RepID=UPI0023E16092|nr:hypothetical protein [Flavipsychrobacter sp. JY13-12]
MKRFCLLLLLMLLFGGRAVYAQQVDSMQVADTPLSKRMIELKEVEVLTDMAKFKKDSALKRTIYRKALKDAATHAEPQLFGTPGQVGISLDGGVSAFAMWVSGKKKKLKKFSAMLAADERQRFTSIRYNAEVVGRIMGIDDNSALAFVDSHPIPYDFVRAASDLEIKMWIRNEYRNASK